MCRAIVAIRMNSDESALRPEIIEENGTAAVVSR
jgi:hypothetical protein